jgi:hypothetical protein
MNLTKKLSLAAIVFASLSSSSIYAQVSDKTITSSKPNGKVDTHLQGTELLKTLGKDKATRIDQLQQASVLQALTPEDKALIVRLLGKLKSNDAKALDEVNAAVGSDSSSLTFNNSKVAIFFVDDAQGATDRVAQRIKEIKKTDSGQSFSK